MAIDFNTGGYSTSSTTYSSTGDQVWYYYDNDGNLVQGIAPPHTHEISSHNHGNNHGYYGFDSWQIPSVKRLEVQPNDNIVIFGNDGVELMKFNEGVEMKVGGKWVKVEKYLEKIDTLDSMMERMYELLSPWQKKELMYSQLEKQDEEFKHFDPDLFKV